MAGSFSDFSSRLVLVTGASRGVGRCLALALGRRGARVILLARTQSALEEMDDIFQSQNYPPPVLVPLDLTDYEAIDAMGAALFQRFGRLDGLAGLAGFLGELSPLVHMSSDRWEKTIGINLTANYRLLRSLDSLLQQSDSGRVLFMAADSKALSSPFQAGYNVAKEGLKALTLSYAAENKKKKVRANIFIPPRMNTSLYKQAFPGGGPEGLGAVEDILPQLLYLCSPDCSENGQILTPENTPQLQKAD